MLTGCREYRPRLIEWARGTVASDERRALMTHVEACADCGRVLDEQMALSAALDGMAGEALPEMAEIEARVLAEFDRAMWRRRRSRWVLVAGLAAAALIGLVWVERREPAARPAFGVRTDAAQVLLPATVLVPRPAASVVRVRHKVVRQQAREEGQPFVTIPYTMPLSPEERTTVVRMEISVAALIAAGFSVAELDPGAVVEADVLVSQDGRARAIRILSGSASN